MINKTVKDATDMYVCIDKSIGNIVASDEPLQGTGYIECDGRQISRTNYPALFDGRYAGDKVRLPDMHSVLDGVRFYMRVK